MDVRRWRGSGLLDEERAVSCRSCTGTCAGQVLDKCWTSAVQVMHKCCCIYRYPPLFTVMHRIWWSLGSDKFASRRKDWNDWNDWNAHRILAPCCCRRHNCNHHSKQGVQPASSSQHAIGNWISAGQDMIPDGPPQSLFCISLFPPEHTEYSRTGIPSQKESSAKRRTCSSSPLSEPCVQRAACAVAASSPTQVLHSAGLPSVPWTIGPNPAKGN